MMPTPWSAQSLMAFAVGLAFDAASALAQRYSDNRIRLVQGFAAGGNANVIARIYGTDVEVPRSAAPFPTRASAGRR